MIQLIKHYIKDRWLTLGTFLICICIFTCIFSLYNITMEPILYASYLSFIFIAAASILDFIFYIRKHRNLQTNLDIAWLTESSLYNDHTLIGKDYQKIIQHLSEELRNEKMKDQSEKKDMEDYYSLWVHQIKLPISAMKLLLETQKNVDKQLLQSELFRIDQYTDMVLTYLRMNSPDTDYQFTQFDIDAILRPVIRKFSHEFIRKKIRLQYSETHSLVLSDEKWLSFIIEQLLSNALKYTETGTIKIYMDKDTTLIIEDSGIGIDSSDLPRIFEKGYTGFNGRYDKKASGIGLYLCKTIANRLSHKLEIHSQKNIGTKAILHLDHYDLKVE